ncbi:hypothetical protein L1987_37060 [Smallanthus sonchifolius]|uniref:Uncharacterized protein n=1 Tax=Smallanthus sonchifolius TaxID=185202 RepID=A0ACB9HG61_9ASTR|nr:hypothetical protein L1987_37060 [Smallanthus sonchifolius]
MIIGTDCYCKSSENADHWMNMAWKLLKNKTQGNNMNLAHEVTHPSRSSSNEYHYLRHKYLLLEEESFNLGRETKGIQDAVTSLEEEKLTLLDELVVLEGLIDLSEMDPTWHSQ